MFNIENKNIVDIVQLLWRAFKKIDQFALYICPQFSRSSSYIFVDRKAR